MVVPPDENKGGFFSSLISNRKGAAFCQLSLNPVGHRALPSRVAFDEICQILPCFRKKQGE
jgi:hypothetical protein